MTIAEARRIIHEYEYKSVVTDDEEFLLLEALEFMIDATKETEWMVRLGGYHYEKRNFDLALKYYEMADELGDEWAPLGLGYIWYYGRTGVRDYDKAFHYYHKAMENGYLQAMVKVADLYKNGYGTKQNYNMYVELIETAYDQVKDAPYMGAPVPEIFTRLAKIRTEQGNTDEAIDLYVRAKDYLIRRISGNPFFGDLNIMKWLEEDLYELIDFDRADFDLYDLFVLMREPAKVAFMYDGAMFVVEAVREGNSVSIRFGDNWYRDIDEFFAKATIAGERIPVLCRRLYNFKVV